MGEGELIRESTRAAGAFTRGHWTPCRKFSGGNTRSASNPREAPSPDRAKEVLYS